jgi:uncharacterized protein YodC (DUF2158 family)
MPSQFEVGLVVRLKSGGPKMTVIASEPYNDGTVKVSCTWFSNDEPKSGTFIQEALTLEGATS